MPSISGTNILFNGLRDDILNVNILAINVEGRQVSIVYFDPADSNTKVTSKWINNDQYSNPYTIVTSGGTWVS